MDRLIGWLNTVNTTNARIGVTLAITVGTAVRYLVWGVPVAAISNGVPVLDGWGYWLLFLAGMAGLDVAQYVGKRFSDSTYAAAKNTGASPVNVEAPAVLAPVVPAVPVAQLTPVVRAPVPVGGTVVNVLPPPARTEQPPNVPLGDVRDARADHDEASDL